MARPLKSSVILNKMTLAFDPQSKAPLAFAGHIPDLNEVLPSGVPEKASDLLRKLADLADKVFDETSKEGNSCSDTKAELEKLRNLAWGDSPEKAIILAEKMSFVGERTKSCLLKHLAEQDILLRELRAIAQIASLSYSRRSVSGPLWAFAAAGCIARTTGIAGVCFTAFGLMGFSG